MPYRVREPRCCDPFDEKCEATMLGDQRGPAVRALVQVNLAQEAYAELKRGLMAGSFKPGARLNIRELAVAMGISPTPVREALLHLAAEGALLQQAGRSFEVPRLDTESYEDIRQLRELLEGEGAYRAAGRISDDQIEELAQIHDALVEAAKSADFRGLLERNYRFHLQLCAAGGSPRLQKIVEGLWLQMGPLLNFLYERRDVPKHGARHQHLNVIDALRARDSRAARRAIQADIAGSADAILRNLKNA